MDPTLCLKTQVPTQIAGGGCLWPSKMGAGASATWRTPLAWPGGSTWCSETNSQTKGHVQVRLSDQHEAEGGRGSLLLLKKCDSWQLQRITLPLLSIRKHTFQQLCSVAKRILLTVLSLGLNT